MYIKWLGLGLFSPSVGIQFFSILYIHVRLYNFYNSMAILFYLWSSSNRSSEGYIIKFNIIWDMDSFNFHLTIKEHRNVSKHLNCNIIQRSQLKTKIVLMPKSNPIAVWIYLEYMANRVFPMTIQQILGVCLVYCRRKR
jgi:hypothetical protein